MSVNLLAVRVAPRTDFPQPVYPQIVDSTVKTWIPVFDQQLSSVRTPDGPRLDVRQYDWAPETGWIFKNLVPTITAQFAPVWAQEAGSFRTGDSPKLDVRSYEWSAESFAVQLLEAQAWAGTADRQISYRTADGLRLDVRTYQWEPEPGWIFVNLPPPPTTAQLWAGIQDKTRSYRTDDGKRLDVRYYEWAPQTGWLFVTNKPPTLVGSICLTETVARENRLFFVPFETRTLFEGAENRKLTVSHELRTFIATCCDCN